MTQSAAEFKISLDEVSRITGENLKTLQARVRRKGLPFEKDLTNRKRYLFGAHLFLAPGQILQCQREREAPSVAPEPQPLTIARSNSLQPVLPFDLSPNFEVRREAVASVASKSQEYVDKWFGIVGDCFNGTWKKFKGHTIGGVLISNNDDYRRAMAPVWGFGYSTVNEKLKLYRDLGKSWKAFAEALVPKPRPGRSGHTFFHRPGNEWMFGKLRDFYLNQAKHSVRAAHDLLIAEIEAKQRAWGIEHRYEKPTLDQSRTALSKLTKPERVLGRQGEKAFNDQCAKYISRDPSTLKSNDLWMTDQKEIDVRLRDGGERLGRIWMVNFLDVASDKVLGFAFGPVLSSEMVMMAACMAIERWGVPRAVHMDLGKEFVCQAFNGKVRRFSGELFYREAQGLWNSLSVKIVEAIGRNPQSKTIERWHGILPSFDRNFPGYCGSNTNSRPEKLAVEEAQHLAWLAGKAQTTPLVNIKQYIHAYAHWAENVWNANARGRGKMRQGMTPNEAYNVKRPEAGFRTISPEELDYRSADHRFVKIARGGQINLTFFGQPIEYEAPELFLHQGEQCEVIISRRTFRQVTVIFSIPGGNATCIATLKPQLAWLPENREELRAAMRCKAAVHRAIRQGVKASNIALAAANPVALLEQQKTLPAKEIIGTQKFFGDSDPTEKPLLHPEISSVEYRMKGRPRTSTARPTSQEVADELLALEGEDAARS